MKPYPELKFQWHIEGLLKGAGLILWKWSIPVCHFGPSTRWAYPDITVGAANDKRGSVAIECKISGGLHTMTQAIGQSLIYKKHGASPVICVPKSCFNSIPNDIEKLCSEHGIVLARESTIVAEISYLLEAMWLRRGRWLHDQVG